MPLTKSQIQAELMKWKKDDLVDYIRNGNIPIDVQRNRILLETLTRIKAEQCANEPNNIEDGDYVEVLSIAMNPSGMDYSNNNQKITKILVIYTGGTIGMKKNENGAYVPVPNAFLERVRSYPELHNQKAFNQLVKCNEISEDSKAMVIPNVRNQQTALYEIKEYDPLLDSSNMSSQDWIRIAKDIYKHYKHYDSFVILHGTDTLSYTASALSFMLQNLDKAVIVTGSQIPIFETNSDAKSNFLNSIIFACVDQIKEVCVCFANKLLRGNRTVKISSTQLDAFSSPNYHNLGHVEMQLKVHNLSLLRKENLLTELALYTNLEKNITELRFSPMMTLNTIKRYIKPPMKGVVLSSYGFGNIPNNMEGLMDAIKSAVETDGILIVNVTQCNQGTIGNSYATSQALESIGVIAGNDLTSVAALVKLSYVLGREDWTRDQKINAMRNNLCGEMTMPEDT